MRQSKRLNILILALSITIGALAWFLCLAVYNALCNTLPRPLLIGLMFGILALAVSAGVFTASLLSSTFMENIVTGSEAGTVIALIALGVVMIAGLAALFQWIYGLHFSLELAEPTSYIFVIDDSGSMENNDPQQLRFDAINKVLENKNADFPYMVYAFADNVTLLRDMQPASSGMAHLRGASAGGTAIKGVLERVIADHRNKVWDGGNAPKVVLLTDGFATDLDWYPSINGTLEQYFKSGISISTVGLGKVDTILLEQIAKKTGGIFIDIKDAAMLAEAMSHAVAQYAADDLLTTRYSGRLGALFGFLRILFVSTLGVCISLVVAVSYGQTDCASLIVLVAVIKSVLGALLLELCTSLLRFPDRIFWFILWVLIATTICTKVVEICRGPSRPSLPPRRPSRSSGKTARVLR